MTLGRACATHLLQRSLGAALGVAVDRITAEPTNRLHPVAWLGLGLERLEAYTYGDNRKSGSVHAALASAGTVATGALLRRALKPLPAAELIGTGLCVSVSSGLQMLGTTALEIRDHLDAADLEAARQKLPHLVGRDPSHLDEVEICRAVVESVAENTVDAATSVVSYAVLSGAQGVLLHRTINTLDAMVGHHSERYENFGWASAKADDIANWLPARISVLAVAVAAATLPGLDLKPTSIVATAFADGRNHPSPNAGLIEAAFAASLGVTLGGSNVYGGLQEERSKLGSGHQPAVGDIERAVRLSQRTVEVLLGFCLLAAAVAGLAHKLKRDPGQA